MNNEKLRNILIKELNIDGLSEEAQNEVIEKLGEIILKSITVAIFEKLSNETRKEFESLNEKGNPTLVKEFLEKNVPDLDILMEEEVRKTIKNFNED